MTLGMGCYRRVLKIAGRASIKAALWRWLILGGCLGLLLVLTSCGVGLGRSGEQPTPTPTPRPTSYQIAQQFLQLWQDRRYSEMYDLLSATAQQSITREKFVGRYEAIAEGATITGIRYQLGPDPGQDVGEIPFSVVIETSFFGPLHVDNVMTLVDEGAGWKVDWSPSLIFPKLTGNNLVHVFIDRPKRGTIYDRNGSPLAIDAEIPVVGVIPDQIEDQHALASTLASRLGMRLQEVEEKLSANVPSYYFIPVKKLPYTTPQEVVDQFFSMPGVIVKTEVKRVYPYGSLAAHVLGFMTEVTEEDLKTLAAQGYEPGDMKGAIGLERFYEKELAGQRGGKLAIITPEGRIVEVLARREPKPGRDIYLSIDVNVQLAAESALGSRRGAMVVVDPSDNSVLAMASNPRFDPNLFVSGLTAGQWQRLNSDPAKPLLHRAAQATYPPGSTFKVVTTAAGLERGGYNASSRFRCSPTWDGLGPSFVKRNWQNIDRGLLTLAEGLMASCNPVFYEVGLTLDHIDPNILPSFAKAFGLGQPTGIMGIEEEAGVVPDPEWKERAMGEPWYSGDSVNMSIGQGFLLVTPLQLANMYSALADGAVLRRPLLVKKISAGPDAPEQIFAAEEIRRLPISQSTLDVIHNGMTKVVADPGGSAYGTFVGMKVPFAGKSGTAEDLSQGADHVWFAAYAPRENPKAVAVVVLDEGKSGSVEAGPMVRKVIESYVLGTGGG